MGWANRILNLDRRIIYLTVALCVFVPLIKPLSLPVVATPNVQGIFDAIEKLPEGSPVLISADFDAASKPELQPMLDAALAHCFAHKLKPVVMTLWLSGPRLIQQSVERQARTYGAVNGVDYAYLGYRPGNFAVVAGLVNSITGTFNSDYYNTPTASMPIFTSIHKLSDFQYIFNIAAGSPGLEEWVVYGASPAHVDLGLSCTAVSATQYYPYLQAGQITGLANGMKGSAEYERLLRDHYTDLGLPPGDAMKGMDSQSLVHLFLVLAIIVANIAYFMTKGSRPARARA
jgi:hypothetical protein